MIDKNLIDQNWEEHYVKKGDPNKPTYYIVRRRWTTTGLFSNFIVFAGHIRYALSQGWLPVVDMQNYPNPYLAPEKLGKENSWEYYFEQPLRIGLEEAYNGENVILGNLDWISSQSLSLINPALFKNRNHDHLIKYLKLVNSGLLMIKPDIMEEILSMREMLFSKNDRVLGVKLRGTDYIALKPRYHQIPPPISLAVDTVRTKLKEWNCNKIFLATEDYRFVEVFKNTFGDLCITTDKEYVDYNYNDKKGAGDYRFNRDNDYFLRGKEYLTEIVILSMCNSFVGVVCQGATAALVMSNNRFENIFTFDLGVYRP